MVLKADDRSGPTWIIVIAGAFACAALVAGLVYSLGRPAARVVDAAVLRSGSSFGVSGTVANLTPGLSSRMILRVTNRTSGVITLTTVTIKVPTVPARCPAANLTINGAHFAGSPPAVTIRGLRARVLAHGRARVALTMHLARRASDRCQRARFPLSYSGFAITGRRGVTTFTHLSSPANSSAGRPVIFSFAGPDGNAFVQSGSTP